MKPSISKEKQEEIKEYHNNPNWDLVYWKSDQWGRSANGGDQSNKWHAEAGKQQKIEDNKKLETCPKDKNQAGLHGTRQPNKWEGQRLWLVALYNKKMKGTFSLLGTEDKTKCASVRRKILCEIKPNDVIESKLAASLGIPNFYYTGNLTRTIKKYGNFNKSEFVKCDLNKSIFAYCELVNAKIKKSKLESSEIIKSDCTDLSFVNSVGGVSNNGPRIVLSNLYGAKFINCDFKNMVIKNCSIKEAIFQGCKLQESKFLNLSLKNVKFKNCQLRFSNFLNCNFAHAEFENCSLRKTNLTRRGLHKCKFDSDTKKALPGHIRNREDIPKNVQL